MLSRCFLVLAFTSVALGLKANFNHGFKGITTTKPLVIAHKGASGTFPEHTAKSYQVREM